MALFVTRRFVVRVVPSASFEDLVYLGTSKEGVFLKVHVTVPPEKGKANRAVQDLLARSFHLAPRNVILKKGGAHRTKVYGCEGWTEDQEVLLNQIVAPQTTQGNA